MNMNEIVEDAISRGYDPLEDYTPNPMSVERYRAWCAENGITPNPNFGVGDDNPPF